MAIAAVTYMVARTFGTWELYLVSLAFVGTLLVSWIAMVRVGQGLTAARTVTPSRPVAGDDLVVSVRLTNASLLPGVQVTLFDAAGNLAPHRRTMEVESLGARSARELSTEPQLARRGVYDLPVLWAEAQDPLGLIRHRLRLGDGQELTVYPRLVYLRSCTLCGDHGTRQDWGRQRLLQLGGSEFRGIRPHYPGEPLHHVDWKSTARTGSLMLREMDEPVSSDLTLLLDGAAAGVSSEAREAGFELAVQATGSVAAFALGGGRAVNLLLHDRTWQQTELTPDLSGRLALLESLAPVTAVEASPLPSWLLMRRAGGKRRAPAKSLTCVALRLDAEFVSSIIALQRQGLQINVIHVAASSFEPGAAAQDVAPSDADAGPLTALAAAGVGCLTLRRGDDLRSTLALSPAAGLYASLR